ncbi:MAG: universal stress protein [Thermodesulfovibrionales bacterium]
MKKVLLAVDETKGSKSVLSVFRESVRTPEEVILVHVEQFEGKSLMTDMLGDAEMETLRESLRETDHKGRLDRKAGRILAYYKKELEESGAPAVKAVLREGRPADEILKVAREEEVDLIVMGCNGKTGLSKLISGCTTKDVEKNSPVPVLVAKTCGCEKVFGWREAYVPAQ